VTTIEAMRIGDAAVRVEARSTPLEDRTGPEDDNLRWE
jgi:hypothetical protein